MISSIKKDTLWSIDYQCFNCFLAERVYSLETHKVKDSSGTPLQKSELNTNYLLAGVGAVIFMILFVIVIEIRRISKPSKRKPLLLPKRHENQTCDETFKRLPNGSSLTYLNKTSSKLSAYGLCVSWNRRVCGVDANSRFYWFTNCIWRYGNLPKFINNLTRNTS